MSVYNACACVPSFSKGGAGVVCNIHRTHVKYTCKAGQGCAMLFRKQYVTVLKHGISPCKRWSFGA